jgi:hypothetical protein
LQWKRVVVHGSCASDLRQSGRPDRPEACLCVKIGTVINVYPVGVPGAKKSGQNSLNWGLASSMSSSHKEVLHLTLESLERWIGCGALLRCRRRALRGRLHGVLRDRQRKVYIDRKAR